MTQRQVDVNGWFEVKRNPLSRVGVFPYSGRSVGLEGADASRTVRVYRPESELADPECLASFKLLPWVDEHTMLGPDDGMTPAEQKGVQGVIGEEVFYDSGVLYGNIKAFSNSLGRLIAAGKKQLSAGYRCVYDWTAGNFNGQPYDCVQRQIRGNHLALVQEGRMGPSVAVMDSFRFTFDAQEAIAMADPKDNAGAAGGMTLEAAVKLLGDLAPQISALQAAFAQLAAPPAEGAAVDKVPAAPVPPVAPPSAAPAAAAPAQDKVPPAPAAAGMDSLRATVEGLAKTVASMDAALRGMPAAIVSDTAARDKLADRIAAHVGTFDAADKTLSQVAAYGCEKFGLKPPAGAEVYALDAYLQGKGSPDAATVRTGQDAAPGAANFVTRHLDAVAAK